MTNHKENPEGEFTVSSDICNTCSKNKLKPKAPTVTDTIKYWPLFKGHGKYGKFWIVSLSIFLKIDQGFIIDVLGDSVSKSGGGHNSNLIATLTLTLMPFIFMILYFGFRRKFIKIWEYERWKPGIVAWFYALSIVIGMLWLIRKIITQ